MTPEQIVDHVARRVPDRTVQGAPERLEGGLLNEVWRMPALPAPIIVKHAPPYMATAPEWPLDPRRLLFEARSLQVLGRGGTLTGVAFAAARPPRLIDLDLEAFILVMEDVGDLTDLANHLRFGGSGVRAGSYLGAFIGALHRESFGRDDLAEAFQNLDIQRTRLNLQYRAVEALCRRVGLADAEALGQRVVQMGERLLEPGACLLQGDLWPASVLVAPLGLRIIDWEFAHFGSPAQDVGHLAAHLWMLAQRAPDVDGTAEALAMNERFLEAYAAAIEPVHDVLWTPWVLEAAALHFGAEILIRTVGAFQAGFLYEGLTLEAPDVQEAIAVAAAHLREPAGVETFEHLRFP